METSDGEKPRVARPQINSHHSSSVPSTPYQQPRFHSRSPSPGRTIGSQSPRSVLSETVAAGITQRSVPLVCKYETGAEFRKRRIPYVEGGNDELRPPDKEPKRALEPDEREKLSGDMRELYDRLLPSEESEKRRALLVMKLETMLNEKWPGNDIRVHVFGSSGNDLSSSDSDVDICITTALKKLESMHEIAALLDKNGMQRVACRASAKVPIVKCWDPDLQLAADLNVNNTLALENTQMIKTYVRLDERVRPLTKIIKYWTKRRILNDAALNGTISSYTWICMVIGFLQRRDPPVLPSLQRVAAETCSEGHTTARKFADDVEKLRGFGSANKESLADLLFHFFRHYGYEFEYAKHVVSIKEGRLLSRKEKGWDSANYQDKEARNRLCVEEPFTTNRNLGNSADDYAWSGIHTEIRRAFDLIADGGQLDSCCEQFEFPPDEKPIFQRPVPRPKPTLTRSASQSGRSNHEQGSSRSSRKSSSRNQSSQRSGNRRASSGAAFSNQRGSLAMPSPLTGTMMEYFAAKGDLHNHLYQQYQLLQIQQEALQRQLHQTAQVQQAHSQARSSEPSGSPMIRAHTNGLPSPRFTDAPLQTAPLLPGYLYNYPSKYPSYSPVSQARSREGSSTNPPSPLMSAAPPSLRRQAHRGPVQGGTTGTIRSQSQPGRSLPNPLAMPQHMFPAYDLPVPFSDPQQHRRPSVQAYTNNPLTPQSLYSPHSAVQQAMHAADSPISKEYIGYYVGQSPLLGPQYPAVPQMQMPRMSLRDPLIHRPRRVTPDLAPPRVNGWRSSRSPSPLDPARNVTAESSQSIGPDQHLQDAFRYEASTLSASTPASASPLQLTRSRASDDGPVIVNGSNPATNWDQSESVSGITQPSAPDDDLTRHENGLRDDRNKLSHEAVAESSLSTRANASATSLTPPPKPPSPKLKALHKLSFAPNGLTQNGNITPESTTAPALLSPVAEMRTPSPARSIARDRESPRTNGVARGVKMANIEPAKRNELELPILTNAKHERKMSAPNPTLPKAVEPSKQPVSPTAASPWNTNGTVNSNPWQQATRKGHKKSKSTSQAKSIGGDPFPANEFERKGG